MQAIIYKFTCFVVLNHCVQQQQEAFIFAIVFNCNYVYIHMYVHICVCVCVGIFCEITLFANVCSLIISFTPVFIVRHTRWKASYTHT